MARDVVDLSDGRARRASRVDEAAVLAARHPALRWVAGETYWLAHRRGDAGGAACGAEGDLVLAPPGVPLCGQCYPALAAAVNGDAGACPDD